MQVPADLGKRAHGFDQSPRDMPWMWAGKPDAFEPRDVVEAFEERGEVASVIVGCLVVVDDLPEELNFQGALAHCLLGLGNDRCRRTHPLVTARVRHDAECAELVAPFDDRHVRLE